MEYRSNGRKPRIEEGEENEEEEEKDRIMKKLSSP